MNLEQLTKTVSDRLKYDHGAVYKVVREIFIVIKEEVMSGEDVKIKSFGSFVLSLRKRKLFHNVATGNLETKPSHYKVKFVPSKSDFTPEL